MTNDDKKASSKLRFLAPLIIFGALAGLLLYGLGQDPRKVPSPLLGKAAPEFSLPDLLDPSRKVSRADLDGEISLVNVWASWCVSCRAEHPMLMKLAQRDDFQVIGLNWKDDKADATAVLRMTGNPYRLNGFDPDNKVGIHWGVYGSPETFLVDRRGIIRHKHIGPIDPSTWEQVLEPLIEQIKREQAGSGKSTKES